MLKFLSRLSGRLKASQRPERVDAKRIYAKVMKQARNPVFYAEGLVEDSTDGRMEWLAAHLSVVMHSLQDHGEDGAKLSQALYDTMVDDFDIALREEGLSDSGVKHRIKPMAKMILSRARTYSDVLNASDVSLSSSIQKHVLHGQGSEEGIDLLSKYLGTFSSKSKEMTLDQIADAALEFPSLRDLAG